MADDVYEDYEFKYVNYWESGQEIVVNSEDSKWAHAAGQEDKTIAMLKIVNVKEVSDPHYRLDIDYIDESGERVYDEPIPVDSERIAQGLENEMLSVA